MNKKKLIQISRGLVLAELVLKNAKIVNVFTKSIEANDIAISDGIIVGIGSYEGENEIDLKGQYVAPGFIDGHVHIESSMLTPNNYALATIPRGTTSIIADCHEIANVAGKEGIDFMIESAKSTVQDVFMMIPSCVPSTSFETSGAILKARDIKKYTENPSVYGLGEMMDYQGVLEGDKDVLNKLEDYSQLTIDGHAPGLSGKDLNAYILSGVETDHECVEASELIEKVQRGMYVHLREGSQTKNLVDLLSGVSSAYYDRILLCSDDLHPSDILNVGHIDQNVRLAIKHGLDPIVAISMASINIARCYHLNHYGAIAPGYYADLVVFKNIKKIDINMVYKKGKLVAKDKQALFESRKIDPSKLLESVNINLNRINLDLTLKNQLVYIIGLVKNNITTKKIKASIILEKGLFLSKNNPGLLKLAVIERHHSSNNIGFGIVKDYGLSNGALALTIAHDSHNLICIGDNDIDMYKAIEKIKSIGGGIVLASEGHIIDFLPLEVGGLMSLNDGQYVQKKLLNLENEIRKLGVTNDIEDPFLQLAFLSLAVVPEIKVTDKGLFDVEKFQLIKLEVGEDS